MADPLTVSLLGPPQFALAGTPVPCASKKALALFVYLLLSGKAHARRELAAMFWGRRDEETARASLRAALHRLPGPMSECLIVDRESVRLAASAAPLVDVARFEALARADDLDRLETAAALYQGELLQDFDADATPEFDDWLHAERMRIAQLAQSVFDGVLARHASRARLDAARATSERESALATALRWVALMPGAEAAHRWLMRIYLDLGQRDAALAQYELCQRFLAVTHGRSPTSETRELHDMALAGSERPAVLAEPAGPAQVTLALGHAAVAQTSFVGRLEELAELDQLLADPSCRLLTLHGLGGAGKTRLAHALATQVGRRFAHGVSWVGLEAAEAPDALPMAIAEALGRELPPRGDRAAILAGMLSGQQRLLVLDNVEPLLAGSRDDSDADLRTVVLKILEIAPQVRIVATSREVLGLQEEWVYEVRGLARGAGEQGGAAQGTPPAIELFAQRARQAYLGFSLAAEMPHVLRICEVVEGLPLGLELAAAWVRTVPCGEIAAAIEREAAALTSAYRNRPVRHQSLEAVVAYSWNMLGDEQRNALAGLGLFAGGFTREAAERVAEAPLRMLSVLVDKSLVRRLAGGRYDLHELVRQFALVRLRQMRARHAATDKRHTEFFAALLLQILGDARGPAEVVASSLFRTELANILSAWTRAIAAGRRDVVERMAAPLVMLLITRGLIAIALAEAERGLAALGSNARDDLATSLHMQWGRAAVMSGKPDVAKRELDAALALGRARGRPDVVTRCLYYLGSLAYQQGQLDAADAIAAEALALGADSADPEVRCIVHNLNGSLANMRSRFDIAERHLRIGLDAARENGSPSLIGIMLSSLGVPLYYQGNFAECVALNREAAAIYEALGKLPTAALIHSNIAATLLAQGEAAPAHGHAVTAIRLARDMGEQEALCAALATLADVLLELGRLADARAAALECLEISDSMQRRLQMTEALFLLASIELREGRLECALDRILRLRDLLAERRLDVRVPMLILAAADWVACARADAHWVEARRWLERLRELDDVDATLRERARRLLAREAGNRGQAAYVAATGLTLADLEAEVVAFLARVAAG
ncbi:MAG: BTAD domain-containing putative transcriptional regulator [Casimicrobiaceae bacterium]